MLSTDTQHDLSSLPPSNIILLDRLDHNVIGCLGPNVVPIIWSQLKEVYSCSSWKLPCGQEKGEAGRCNSGVKQGTLPSHFHGNKFCRKSASYMLFAFRALILLHNKPAQNLVAQLFPIILWVDWGQLLWLLFSM